MTNAYTSLATATLLTYPRSDVPIAVTSDASDSGIKAFLTVCQRCMATSGLFSKQLREPERKYNTFDRELLALFLAIRHFSFLLEGRVFTAFTDHKPLMGAMLKCPILGRQCQQRHLSFISEFSTDIKHLALKIIC